MQTHCQTGKRKFTLKSRLAPRSRLGAVIADLANDCVLCILNTSEATHAYHLHGHH